MFRVCRVFFVSETAQVELKCERVQAPAQDCLPIQRVNAAPAAAGVSFVRAIDADV